jgi:hypothetical protein
MNNRPTIKLHHVLSALPIVIALAITRGVAAQELGEDEVSLKNGGSVRGTVVSVIPGESVKVIEAGATESTTYAWAEVQKVKKGKYAHHDADPHPASPDQKMVHVHVESPEPAELRHEIATSVGSVDGYTYAGVVSESACVSPCDQDVPAGPYFIDGSYPRTSTFQVSGDSATIVVKPGSTGRLWGGAVLLGVGLTGGAAVGIPLVAVGEGGAGGVVIGVGAAGLLTGIILLATSGSSAEVKAGGAESASVTFAPLIAPLPSTTENGPTASAPDVVNPSNSVFGVRGTF